MKFRIVLSGVLVASLMACGGGTSDAENTTTPVAVGSTPTPTPEPAPTPTPTPTPAPAGNLPTYGPVVTTVNGVDYCKRPLTDEEWGAIRGGRPESDRATMYRLSPCTS